MKFNTYRPEYERKWFQMLCDLYPDIPENELSAHLKTVIRAQNQETFFAIEKGLPIAFIIVSIRSDYVEGATTSPVGYIESVFVKPDFRKTGVARSLYLLAEKWAGERGCTQMGSDTWENDKNAIAFHLKLGFEIEDVLIHFIKDIP